MSNSNKGNTKKVNTNIKSLKDFFKKEKSIYEHNLLIEKLNNFAIEMSENGIYFTLLNNFKTELEKISIQNEPESKKQTIITKINDLYKKFEELKEKSKTITDLKTKVDIIENFLIEFKKSINDIHKNIQELLINYGTENKNLQESINTLKSKHEKEKLVIYQSELNNMLKFENIKNDVTKLIKEIENILNPQPEPSNTQPQTQTITTLLSSIENSIKELYNKIEYTIICDFIELLSLELPEQSTIQLETIEIIKNKEKEEKEEIKKQISKFEEKQEAQPSQQQDVEKQAQAQAPPQSILTTEEKLELFNNIQKSIMEYNLKIHLLNVAIIPKHTELIDLAKEKLSYDESKIQALYNPTNDINIQNNLLDLDKINKKLETELFESSGNNSAYIETFKLLLNSILTNPKEDLVTSMCDIYQKIENKESLKDIIDNFIEELKTHINNPENNNKATLENYQSIINILKKNCKIENLEDILKNLEENIKKSAELNDIQKRNIAAFFMEDTYNEEKLKNFPSNLFDIMKENGVEIWKKIKDFKNEIEKIQIIKDKLKDSKFDTISFASNYDVLKSNSKNQKLSNYLNNYKLNSSTKMDGPIHNSLVHLINNLNKIDISNIENLNDYREKINKYIEIINQELNEPINKLNIINDFDKTDYKFNIESNITILKIYSSIFHNILFEIFNTEAKVFLKIVNPPSAISTEEDNNIYINLPGCDKECLTEKIYISKKEGGNEGGKQIINKDINGVEFGPFDTIFGLNNDDKNLSNKCYFYDQNKKVEEGKKDCSYNDDNINKRPYNVDTSNKREKTTQNMSSLIDMIDKYKTSDSEKTGDSEKNISLLCYGFSGSGKTYSLTNSDKDNYGIFFYLLDKYKDDVSGIEIIDIYGQYRVNETNKLHTTKTNYNINIGGRELNSFDGNWEKNLKNEKKEIEIIGRTKKETIDLITEENASYKSTKNKIENYSNKNNITFEINTKMKIDNYNFNISNNENFIENIGCIYNYIQLLRWNKGHIKRTQNNVESSRSILQMKIKIKNINITLWDLPGSENPLNIFSQTFNYQHPDVKEEYNEKRWKFMLNIMFKITNGSWINAYNRFLKSSKDVLELEKDYKDDMLMINIINSVIPIKKGKFEKKEISAKKIGDVPYTKTIYKSNTGFFEYLKGSSNIYANLKEYTNKIKEYTNETTKYLNYFIFLIELFCEGLFINNYLSMFLKIVEYRNKNKNLYNDKSVNIDDEYIQELLRPPEEVNATDHTDVYIKSTIIAKKNKKQGRQYKQYKGPYNQFKILNEMTDKKIYKEHMSTLDIIKDSYIYIIGHIRHDLNKKIDAVYGNIGTLYFLDKLNHHSGYRQDKVTDNETIETALSTLNKDLIFNDKIKTKIVINEQKGGSRKLSKSKRERLHLKLRQKIKKKTKKQKKTNKKTNKK